MTIEAKLKSLETYVSERLDLHGDWYGKSNIKKMFEELQNDIDDEWGELVRLEGSSVMSKEEVEELNKIKLPF
jgi:hypothetical protein